MTFQAKFFSEVRFLQVQMFGRLRPALRVATLASVFALTGCSLLDVHRDAPLGPSAMGAQLTPVSVAHRDLIGLPPPKGKIIAAVYGFRDQTGQYKQSPDSSFSTAVTQGAGAMLVKAMADSQWFIPVEREGLQNLLTERRIVRALDSQQTQQSNNLSGLLPSSILLEGGVIAYESNVRTGGLGAKYIGIGASEQYRTDQVTINLRAVDIRTGAILVSTSTTKSIYSYKLSADIYRFVNFKDIVEAEAGFTRNEPAQLCVQEAIEAAVVHLLVQGIKDNHWALNNPDDINSPIIQAYLKAQRMYLTKSEAEQIMKKSGAAAKSPAR
jgi:curli production assembly/transport component CsgG